MKRMSKMEHAPWSCVCVQMCAGVCVCVCMQDSHGVKPMPMIMILYCGQKPARRCRRTGAERLPSGLFAGSVCCARVAPYGDRKRQVRCEPGGPNLGVQIHTSVVSFEHTPKKNKKKLHHRYACNCVARWHVCVCTRHKTNETERTDKF